jgi:hypothetical protein
MEMAEVLARLRLIGNKKEAQEQMVAVWRNASTTGTYEDQLKSLTARVDAILDSYRKKSEDVLKELNQLERTITKHKEKMKIQVKEATEWLDPKSKNGFFQLLPKLVADKFSVEKPDDKRYAHFEYEYLDEIANALTRDDTLSEIDSKLAIKATNLMTGKTHIENDECAYCGTHVDLKNLEKRLQAIEKERDSIEEDIKLKDKLRENTERLKRLLGGVIQEYDDAATKYRAKLKMLVEDKKLTKEQAAAKLDEVLIDDSK